MGRGRACGKNCGKVADCGKDCGKPVGRLLEACGKDFPTKKN